MTLKELKEELADIEHQRWSDWQKWVHSKLVEDEFGNYILPKCFFEYWEKQINTPYKELSEKEKDKNREQVDIYWGLVEDYITDICKGKGKITMGDRTFWSEDCPQCHGKDTVEVTDASSSMIFYRRCSVCNWTDGLGYYEDKDNVLMLYTKEEAIKQGLIELCQCGEYMTWMEKAEYGKCTDCEFPK